MPRVAGLLKFTLFLNALAAFGCTHKDYTVLTCQWKEGPETETLTATFCYHDGGACKNNFPDDQAFCAWNVFSSEDPADVSKFSNPHGFAGHAAWQEGSCLGAGGHQSSKAFPPDPDKEGNGCYSESGGSGGSGQSSASAGGTTTTGGTTTDDPTTTGGTGGGLKEYICSTQSPWKCANLVPNDALAEYPAYPDPWTEPGSPDELWDNCWSEVNVNGPPHKSKCAMALSVEDAVTTCEKNCKEYRKTMKEDCDSDPDCLVQTTIDCDLDGTYVNSSGQAIAGDPTGEKPVLSSTLSGWECDGEALLPSEGSSHPFQGSATLITAEGVSAGVASFRGYLGYSLTECTSSTCTLTVDTLVGLTKAVEGGYSDAAGGGGMFEVQEMGFQSRAPFSGTWNIDRDTVSFPNAVLNTQFWAGAVLVDDAPVMSDYGVFTVETDQIVGSLGAAEGPLSLNLTIDMMPFYGVVSVSLHTLPPS